MSSPLRLVYFPARGRAELIRLVLAAAGVEYEETVVTSETMKEWKESGNLSFGQVPLLQDGDFNIVQSNAIARYAARKYDLYGDAKTGALADMILDQGNDFLTKLIPVVYPVVDKEKLDAFKADQIPTYLSQLEAFADTYSAVLGQSKPCLADLALYLVAEGYLTEWKLADSAQYPKLIALMNKTAAYENVGKYIKSDKRYPPRKLE